MENKHPFRVSLPPALAEVEISDSQFHDGRLQRTRRRRLALRIRPLGLWLILGISLALGVWTLLASLGRLALRWLLALLG